MMVMMMKIVMMILLTDDNVMLSAAKVNVLFSRVRQKKAEEEDQSREDLMTKWKPFCRSKEHRDKQKYVSKILTTY